MLAGNGGDWRSKSLALPFNFSTLENNLKKSLK
jgi:hypothetical protein